MQVHMEKVESGERMKLKFKVIDVEKVSKGWERWVVTHLSLPLYLKLFAVCLSVFLGLHLQHMEVLRIGVQSEM